MTATFPAGFRWGAATASYQIEGAVAVDGRGAGIWDTFSHTPGRVLGGDTGDVACDHYHRVEADVAIMADLGLQDYRFSIAWPRIVPAGAGAVEPRGLDFYSHLVDTLLGAGIRPVVTLYHWDLPQALQDEGGWTARSTAERFADYASVVAGRLGDRVPFFSTLNEPWCSAFLGYGNGVHAPGVRDNAAALRAAYHLLLAHGLGLEALRAELPASTELSITINPANVRAVSDGAADRAAAATAELLTNRIFLEPLLRGVLPDDLVARTADRTDWSFVRDGDLARIGAPIDVLGVNYYAPALIGAEPEDPDEPVLHPGTDDVFVHTHPGPLTGIGWAVDPASFTELLVDLHKQYDVPMAITENGSAWPDQVGADGTVDDADRCAYLDAHVRAVGDAIDAGVDVRAYYVWSLLDNFEWAWGYSQRFGIVHVDYETQQRTPKRSAEVYRRIVASHGPGA